MRSASNVRRHSAKKTALRPAPPPIPAPTAPGLLCSRMHGLTLIAPDVAPQLGARPVPVAPAAPPVTQQNRTELNVYSYDTHVLYTYIVYILRFSFLPLASALPPSDGLILIHSKRLTKTKSPLPGGRLLRTRRSHRHSNSNRVMPPATILRGVV